MGRVVDQWIRRISASKRRLGLIGSSVGSKSAMAGCFFVFLHYTGKQQFFRLASTPTIKPEHREEYDLIQQALKRPERFSVLYDRYYKPVFVFVYKRVNDAEVASDLTSQVFLKAMLHLKRYQYQGYPFSSWLFRIALNESNLFFRKQKRSREVALSDQHLVHLVEDSEVDNSEENRQQLVDALNRLEPEQVQLMELRFFERYSFKEIGQMLGTTEANAKMRVYRILKKMKSFLNLKG